MKCLSICQPFALLIIQGKKNIELRNWNTKVRGEFLIHSPQKIRIEDCKRLKIKKNECVLGSIIGKAEITGVKRYQSSQELKKDKKFHYSSKKFSYGTYGFLITNAKPFKVPIPIKGKLRFFEIDARKMISEQQISTELFEEEYNYQWINHH